MSFTPWVSGSYPSDALPDQPDQSIIKTKGTAIIHHVATGVEIQCGVYPIGNDISNSSAIEEHELVMRYKRGPDSSIDADPTVLFRHLNGMPASIKVLPAGIANTDFRPNQTSSDKLNSTALVDITVAGYTTTSYTGCEVAPKWSVVFVRQQRPDETPVVLPRQSRYDVQQPIHTMVMHLRPNVHNHSYDISDQLIDRLRSSLDSWLSKPNATEDLQTAVETAALPHDSQLRQVMTDAGFVLKHYSMDDPNLGAAHAGYRHDAPAYPRDDAADRLLLGQNLIDAFSEHMTQIFRESMDLDDPWAYLEEGLKIFAWIQSRLDGARHDHLDSQFEHKKWGLTTHLALELMRFFGYGIEDEIYNREFHLFGRIMQTAVPGQLNVPFILNS